MIEDYRFGKIVINGNTYTSDVIVTKTKIFPSWWRKEGHKVYWIDLEKFITPDIKIVILGTGASGLMQPTAELKEKLKEKGIKLIALPTKEAIKVFNDYLKKEEEILGGFHLTC
ncbi:MAG TPA: hypothetical protein ENG63_02005 [Candidatus Desulfofervidus auxilii]|uniref:Mth938-like domain-containing protein n=1 Tax=Desulfofervidus auxilii TaxID=1621989 RepID=A0A7C0U1I9_DESA2|nr:hypothetical protein [Candidatus Desulfofervidus auxilii]